MLLFAQAPSVVLTTGHNDQVNAMDISSDGKFLASASNDKQIKIWHLQSALEFRTISGTDGRVEQLCFSPDNRTLAGTSFNNELLVWDVITGEEVAESKAGLGRGLAFDQQGDRLYFLSEDSRLMALNLIDKSVKPLGENYITEFIMDSKLNVIYAMDHLGKLFTIDAANGTITTTTTLFEEFNYPFCAPDISPDGQFIAFGFSDDKFRIFNTKTKVFDYVSKPLKGKIVALSFDQKLPLVYFSLTHNEIIIFNYQTQTIHTDFQLPNTPFYIQDLTPHPNGESMFMASHDLISIFNFEEQKVVRSLQRKVNRIVNMTNDPSGRYLAVASDKLNLKIWDLQLNKVVDSIAAFFPCLFMPDGKHILALNNQLNVGMYEVESGQMIKSFTTDYEVIQSLAVSADGKVIAAAGYQNLIKVWDVASTKRIANLAGHEAGILSLSFHPNDPLIESGSLDQTSRVWNYEKQTLEQTFTDQTISVRDVAFSPNGELLATAAWDKTIKLRSTANWETNHTLLGHENVVNTIAFSKNSTILISGAGNNSVGAADNSIICWDVKNGAQKCEFNNHRAEIIKVLADNDGRFFSASVDGAINYNDVENCEVIATYVSVGAKEFMIYTPDNYYFASRNALKGIGFRIEDKMVPFERYDSFLNRPDLVAKRIGKSPANLIKAYNYLYKKRLRQLNLDEGSIKQDYQLPKLVNESKYELVTNQAFQKFWIKAWDDQYTIHRIHVAVNGVPVYGSAGIEVKGDVKSIRQEIEVPLIEGANKIVVSCRNSNGVESLYEQMEIYRQTSDKKHDLYVISIGVSNYADERFDLKYPKKDAEDVLEKFKSSSPRYKKVHTKLLVDEQVNTAILDSLSDFLKDCTHEDLVVVFLAGHGVLDEEFDYYFATHDMDFDDPTKKGLSYASFSSLMSKIKAYQKVLIMDTCHSGELDKTEIEKGPAPEVEAGQIQFRNAGVGVREKPGLGTENLTRLTQELFADIRQGTGATVISSAGGAEYAMESDDWSGGLFTFVLLKGLNSNAENGVYLSQLRDYVYREVERISNGQQIPTAREENITRDYIIFGTK